MGQLRFAGRAAPVTIEHGPRTVTLAQLEAAGGEAAVGWQLRRVLVRGDGVALDGTERDGSLHLDGTVELGKLAVIVWTAMLVVKKGDLMRRLTKGLLPFLLVLAVLNLLVLLEPDLSMAMTFTLIMGVILFAGGVRIGHVVLLCVIAIPVFWHELEKVQYALLRMTSFFNPGHAPEVVGYQLRQSLIAVGSGGLWGVGFGQGRQQLGFVPFPYNDFIGSNIGEEWGWLGIVGVTLAFAIYGWLGFRIAKQARTPFQQLLAIGIVFDTVSTAFLHIGVVIGLLPTTGLTLPFISYGRTNLVLSILMTGILVNIGSVNERVLGAHATDPLGVTAA